MALNEKLQQNSGSVVQCCTNGATSANKNRSNHIISGENY